MRAIVVTLLLGALVASGCGGEENEAAPSIDTSTTPMATSKPAGAARPLAPMIEGASLDGEPISLADFAGRPVLVNVWSSW